MTTPHDADAARALVDAIVDDLLIDLTEIPDRDMREVDYLRLCEYVAKAEGQLLAAQAEAAGLRADDDCGCGISGCRNTRRMCRACQVARLEERLAEAELDAGRLRAKPARDAVYGNTHPLVYHAVMRAIEDTIDSCHEQRKLPPEAQVTDYAGILVSSVKYAQSMAAVDAARQEPSDAP